MSSPFSGKIGAVEYLFEGLFRFSPDAVIVSNREGHILDANSQTQQLFGYTHADLINQPIEMLIPERFRRGHPAHRSSYVADPHTRTMGANLELYGLRKDRTEFPVDIMLSSVETPNGTVVLSVIRDISVRRRAEEALREAEHRLRMHVEGVRDYAIFMLDPDGRISSWNAGAERLKGYRSEEILGRHFSQFYPPEDIGSGKHDRALKAAATEGRFQEEGWRVRKDGSRFWASVTITALRDPSGKLLGFSKITRDLTERKSADDALRRSEAQLRAIFEHSPDAIIGVDPQGKILEVNAQVRKFFGYERAELIGKPIEMLVPERFRNKHPGYRADYQHAARTRPMGIGLELFGLRKDGTEFPVDIMLSPVDTPEGKMVLSVIRDLSEKKRAQEELNRREREKQYLEEELYTEHRFEDIIGESPVLKRVLKQVETVAATDVTVLILGETGTGKDLIARAIHQLSSRSGHSLVKLNCAAIPTGLLESELFGHERGSFTGAIAQKIGRLELADQGSFFLDEVGELPLELQPKILRALQEKEFERVGGTRTIPVDVRLIAATNRDLGQMVKDHQFRGDLYYRLRVFPIVLPPLRERREDIPLLVRYFVSKHARSMDRRIETIPPDTMKALVHWEWPGNIRELENFVERSVILTKGSTLRAPISELEMPPEAASEETDSSLDSAERDHILRVLRETKGVIAGPNGAAARLGVKRTTLNSKLKKLGIEREDYA
ncbi:MAG TPA: PAS domain S-box protein [Candidatus Dormibacteraeota bacterium]|nr:PAS domain S-box protein [Candidatus Dormibacteraeota bacterium]